jgi:hypothetical protein
LPKDGHYKQLEGGAQGAGSGSLALQGEAAPVSKEAAEEEMEKEMTAVVMLSYADTLLSSLMAPPCLRCGVLE